jgi:hypothetical protein
MNDYQQRILDHLVMMAQRDKRYAWWAAHQYKEIDPYQLSEMPALLTARMKALQALNAQQTGA